MVQHVRMLIGYARTSSASQSLERQLEALGEVDRLFQEVQSARRGSLRPQLVEMTGFARDGDRVLVTSMDRLARSVVDLNSIVSELTSRGVEVRFIKENLTFGEEADSFAEFQLNVMGAFAQLERSIIGERQAEGIAAAKKRGVYQGRGKAITEEQKVQALTDIAKGVPKTVVARKLGVHRTTLYRTLKEST